MGIITADEAVWCKAFVSTSQGKTLKWFNTLEKNSIGSWLEFKKVFMTKFSTAGTLPKDESNLCGIRQRADESLSSYLTRFKNVLEQINNVPEQAVIMCFQGGLMPGALKTEFGLRPLKSSGKMFKTAQKMGTIEEIGGENSQQENGFWWFQQYG